MQNTLEPLWAFDQSMSDFRLFSSEQEWVSHIDVPRATLYLEKH
jgi:hypothetical protein